MPSSAMKKCSWRAFADPSPYDRTPIRGARRSDRRGKDHVANLSDDMVARLRLAEHSIVDESLRQVRRSRPSRHALRPMLVSHVDVKVPVLVHLEQHDLAVVAGCMVGPEASKRRFHGF